jgi:ribonuclease HII
VTNLEALRRAVMTLDPAPEYVLTDGFPVPGMARPGLAVWKGDRVAACVAAASVVAKVTRDRIMVGLHVRHPEYGFAVHKGYVVPEHQAALRAHGPCPEHRFSYVNVRSALPAAGDAVARQAADDAVMVQNGGMDTRRDLTVSAR